MSLFLAAHRPRLEIGNRPWKPMSRFIKLPETLLTLASPTTSRYSASPQRSAAAHSYPTNPRTSTSVALTSIPEDVDALSGPTFTFLVGPWADDFVIHVDLFSRQSQYFKCLMKGDMREASDRQVVLENIQAAAFHRICQYVYSRDYTISSWQDEMPGPRDPKHVTVSSTVIDCIDLDANHPPPRKRRKISWDSAAAHEFVFGKILGERLPLPAAPLCYTEAYQYTLQQHMDVYILGDRFMLPGLKELAVQKLRASLCILPVVMVQAVLPTIVNQAVIYAQPSERLRKVLALFLLAVSDRFEGDGLLRECPAEFAQDVFAQGMLSERCNRRRIGLVASP